MFGNFIKKNHPVMSPNNEVAMPSRANVFSHNAKVKKEQKIVLVFTDLFPLAPKAVPAWLLT